jgi:hypothetical protein
MKINDTLKKVLYAIIVVGGAILGVLNLGDAGLASFTFPEGGFWGDWIFIWFGLIAFLPLMILGNFFPKASGWLLIVCSIIATIMLIISAIFNRGKVGSDLISLTYFIIRYSVPMLIYGLCLIYWMKDMRKIFSKK